MQNLIDIAAFCDPMVLLDCIVVYIVFRVIDAMMNDHWATRTNRQVDLYSKLLELDNSLSKKEFTSSLKLLRNEINVQIKKACKRKELTRFLFSNCILTVACMLSLMIVAIRYIASGNSINSGVLWLSSNYWTVLFLICVCFAFDALLIMFNRVGRALAEKLSRKGNKT